LFTPEAIRALALSSIAGFSTMIGAVVVIFIKKKSDKLITASLGFAGGVMLSVSFIELLPNAESYLTRCTDRRLGVLVTVLSLVVGILFSTLLDRFVPHQEVSEEGEREHMNLFRVGIISALAIWLHNFPEGIATFMAGYSDTSLGITIAVAISMHNIPEGLAVAMPIYVSTGSKKKAFKYTFLSAIAEPVGALLAFAVLRPFINDMLMGIVFAFIAGIMIYIAIEELIPSSRQYGHKGLALFSVFFGICLMPLANIF
jgi:ZIP family zinc transporter